MNLQGKNLLSWWALINILAFGMMWIAFIHSLTVTDDSALIWDISRFVMWTLFGLSQAIVFGRVISFRAGGLWLWVTVFGGTLGWFAAWYVFSSMIILPFFPHIDLSAYFFMGAILGIFTGFFQWLALRSWDFRNAWRWLPAQIGGMACAFLTGGAIMAALDTAPTLALVVSALMAAVVMAQASTGTLSILKPKLEILN